VKEAPPASRFTRLVDTIQYLVGVAAATAVVLLFSLGRGDSPPDQAATAAVTDPILHPPRQLALGQSIYAAQCAICHGPTGAGGTGPALDRGMADKYPDARSQELVVALGRNAMVGFGDQLTPDEISAVVVYTRVALGRGDP
jgi:mono/diheme cytochrome c family protein